MNHILQIKNLKTVFKTDSQKIYAVNDLSLDIPRGQITALVGESGSGKSVTAMSVLRLIQKPGVIESGDIILHDAKLGPQNLLKCSESEIRAVRGHKIAMIFQEPMSSLNPVFTVGNQIVEAIQLHQNFGKKDANDKAIEMLRRVGISNPESRVNAYPHELSGGMRQRVMIAMALSCHPDLLIADEPTTALDVTIQAQILELIHQLVEETHMSVLLITHDMGIVAEYAHKVAVMYCGQIVEEAETIDLFKNSQHPYTKGLLASIPSLRKTHEKYLKAIPGVVPALSQLPLGCAFQERCPYVQNDCKKHDIPLFLNHDNHSYRCLHPNAL